MVIKRNDPCTCGSGEKYKKCCLVKENAIDIEQVKQERFFDLKHAMVLKISGFLYSKLTFREEDVLKATFKKRLNKNLPSRTFDSFFKFWLLFFHEFENRLRGVEWFYEEEGNSLSPEAGEMVKRWITLVPKLIQAVNHNENGMIAKDFSSNETVFLPDSDTLPEIRPWQVTFGLIEPIDNEYFLNGVTSWAAPRAVDEIINELNRFITTTGKTYNQVAMEYYPELLSIILNHNNVGVSTANDNPSQIIQEQLTYTLHNKERILDYLFKSKEVVVEENEGNIIWVGDWYCYTDSSLKDPIYLADSYGDIVVKEEELTLESIHPEKIVKFENWAKQFSNEMTLRKKDKKVHSTPVSIHLENHYVLLSKATPLYFAHYAQSRFKLAKLDLPIPQFDGLSLKEMMERGRMEEIERWLEQYEFNSYMIARESTEEIKHTEDFSWIRKELGLPLSPFVSNYTTRETSISQTGRPKAVVKIIEREIPYFKQLGFTIETATEFYGQDIVDFFMEKTKGRTKGTIAKYENGMSYLVDYFSNLEEGIDSWSGCTQVFWEPLISDKYLDLNKNLTNTQKQAILSTISSFVRWLDKRYDTNHAAIVKGIITENEKGFLQIIN